MYVQVGCETFCLDDDVAIQEATAALKTEACATAEKIKLFPSAKSDDIALGESCLNSVSQGNLNGRFLN